MVGSKASRTVSHELSVYSRTSPQPMRRSSNGAGEKSRLFKTSSAVRDDRTLTGRDKPLAPREGSTEGDRGRRLEERLRAEFIAGAEEESRRRSGRPLTSEELGRVLR